MLWFFKAAHKFIAVLWHTIQIDLRGTAQISYR